LRSLFYFFLSLANENFTLTLYNDFQETAKKEGKTFSAFMRDCARHRNNSLEPRLVMHMQNVMNTAVELILRYEPQNTKTVEKLEKEMEELWNRLN